MRKYRVHFVLQKGGSRMTNYVDVNAESDYMASKLAEGQARARYSSRDDWELLVTKIEAR